ncbi:YdcF family protein [Inquilinus limosus]|uniref:YdcF family protein n=1 Tax=Inquilinus limosus TaxID=171674 RepID=UPI003F17C948
MKPRFARIRRICVVIMLISLTSGVAVAAALKAAEPLLLVRTSLEPADVIVVLGGNGPSRAWRAAALYRQGVAPRVLVTGIDDCESIRSHMVDSGVPRNVIQIECAARNTWENAVFSAPMLTAMGARRAVLVTSWFHTRRALACFRQVLPQLEWMSGPVERDESYRQMIRDNGGLMVLKEYLKIAWYSLRYGLVAF